MHEFLEHARGDPDKLRVGSPGEGTSSPLNLEELMRLANAKMAHVPFSGWGQGSPALLGSHIDALVAQPGELRPQVEGKKMRVLLTFQPTRHQFFPDAPAARELGHDVTLGTMFVLTAPKGTPAPALKYIHDTAKAAMEDPAYATIVKARGVDLDYRPGEAMRQELWREYRRHTDILKRLGLIKR